MGNSLYHNPVLPVANGTVWWKPGVVSGSVVKKVKIPPSNLNKG